MVMKTVVIQAQSLTTRLPKVKGASEAPPFGCLSVKLLIDRPVVSGRGSSQRMRSPALAVNDAEAMPCSAFFPRE